MRLEAQRQDRHPAGYRPLSPGNATVADAVRLGADAVGYTLYVGSPAQERDLEQYRQVPQRSGVPLSVGSCPRGEAIETIFPQPDKQYGAAGAGAAGAGAAGLIFGRNTWQHEPGESLRSAAQLKDILAKHRSG